MTQTPPCHTLGTLCVLFLHFILGIFGKFFQAHFLIRPFLCTHRRPLAERFRTRARNMEGTPLSYFFVPRLLA